MKPELLETADLALAEKNLHDMARISARLDGEGPLGVVDFAGFGQCLQSVARTDAA